MKFKILPSLFTYFLLFFAANAKAQGGVLPLNSSVNGNLASASTDVYTVTTTGYGLLRLTFSTVSPADMYVTLYDNDGTTVITAPVESYSAVPTVVVPTDGLAPGTYTVKITPYNTTTNGAYTLADSLFVSPLAGDAEPNGSRATADNLSLNGSATGHLGYYYNNQRDTTDWFKITTNADGRLAVYLSTSRSSVYSNNNLDVNMYVYDNDGVTVLGSKEVYLGYNPTNDSVTIDGLEPGTYYVRLQNYNTTNEFADYTISNTLLTPPLANDVESNGSTATASVLPLNGTKTGHLGYYYNNQRDTTDWYKVTTTSDGLLKVFLTTARGSIYSNNNLDVNMYVYDNDGVTQLGYKEVYLGYNPTSDSITIDGLEPGTYYIRLQNYSISNEFSDYSISNTLITPPVANDVEPNGSPVTASVLPLNGTKTGHLGYYYNNQRDTTDWYKVTTTADGLLKVFLTTSRGSVYSTNNLDVKMYLYDNDATTQLGYKEVYLGYNPTTDSISVDGLEPGTYYISLQNYSINNEFSDYAISDTLVLPKYVTDAEPNGTPATALAFPPGSTTKGHVGYYYNNQRDTSDWYKLTTVTAGPLYVYLSSLRGNTYSNSTNNPLDMLLYLYGSDGTTQLGSVEVYNGYNPAVDSLFFSNLAAGTYYVKVTNYSPNTEFANYSLTNSASPGALLPVSFISFDGVLNGDRANLTWSTATELNNTGFDVQKSSDGQTFSTIGFVKGNGNSSVVNNYNYTDIKVLSGYNYYRLKQLDIDGNFNYSSIIRLDFSKFDWAVFGNPVTSNSWIQLQIAKTSKVAIQILTVDGRIMKTINKGTLSMGTYSYPLSLGNVPSGMYIVRLITDNGIFSKKIVK